MPLPALIAVSPDLSIRPALDALPPRLELAYVADWNAALEALRLRDWGACLLDTRLPGVDPLAGPEAVREIRDGITLILLTEDPVSPERGGGGWAEEGPTIRIGRGRVCPEYLEELLHLAGMERRSHRACAALVEENRRLRERVASLGPSGPGTGGFPRPESPSQAEDLRLLAEMKTQLLYHIAHELRSPLVSVRGYTEMFYRGVYGELPEKQRGYLERSLENIDRLTQLVASLVRYVTFAREHPPLRLERLSLTALVRGVEKRLAAEAAAAGVAVRVDPPESPAVVVVDRDAIATVLTRLIRNAIRFSPRTGEVRILFDRVDRHLIKLRVEDSGPGVSSSDLLRMFAEPPVHTLSRIRDLLRLHGSELRVTHVPEGGASFYFTLALMEGGAETDSAAEGEPGDGHPRRGPGPGSPRGRMDSSAG